MRNGSQIHILTRHMNIKKKYEIKLMNLILENWYFGYAMNVIKEIFS